MAFRNIVSWWPHIQRALLLVYLQLLIQQINSYSFLVTVKFFLIPRTLHVVFTSNLVRNTLLPVFLTLSNYYEHFIINNSHVSSYCVCTGCWWGSLRERGHWGDQDVNGRIILRWIFRKLEWVVGTGWSWLRIGTGGGHLWVR